MTIKLLLVDDQEMIRLGMAMALNAEPELEVVAEADNGKKALALLGQHQVDVVLMDVRMPQMDGIEATRRILASASPPKVLVLTTFDTDEYAFGAIKAGASGFLIKDGPIAELVTAIKHVYAGDAVIAPATTKRLLKQVGNPQPEPKSHPLIEQLTERETEVLLLLAQGLSNSEIASELVLTIGTVKVHVGHILEKLQVRDRLQAVIMAYQSGIVDTPMP